MTPELPTRRFHQQQPSRVPQRSQSQPADLTQVREPLKFSNILWERNFCANIVFNYFFISATKPDQIHFCHVTQNMKTLRVMFLIITGSTEKTIFLSKRLKSLSLKAIADKCLYLHIASSAGSSLTLPELATILTPAALHAGRHRERGCVVHAPHSPGHRQWWCNLLGVQRSTRSQTRGTHRTSGVSRWARPGTGEWECKTLMPWYRLLGWTQNSSAYLQVHVLCCVEVNEKAYGCQSVSLLIPHLSLTKACTVEIS